MYVKNITKKDIKLNSFEGYVFSIPPGASWIWDKAGEHLLANIYRVESKGGKDIYGFDNGHGVPALKDTTEKEWVKEGKKLTEVKRFQIVAKMIPRNKLVIVAQQRGISTQRLTEYQLDNTIDVETIANDINELPVPDEIRFPQNLEDENHNS